MDVQIKSFRLMLVAMAAIGCVATTARADTTDDRQPISVAPQQPTAPSVNNEAFAKMRAQCEKDVPMGKANGDICAEAAALLVGNDIPEVTNFRLSDPMNTSESLFQSIGVPWQIVIDHQVGPLQVDSLPRGICGHQNGNVYILSE